MYDVTVFASYLLILANFSYPNNFCYHCEIIFFNAEIMVLQDVFNLNTYRPENNFRLKFVWVKIIM